jgi:hypothetical protein
MDNRLKQKGAVLNVDKIQAFLEGFEAIAGVFSALETSFS